MSIQGQGQCKCNVKQLKVGITSRSEGVIIRVKETFWDILEQNICIWTTQKTDTGHTTVFIVNFP